MPRQIAMYLMREEIELPFRMRLVRPDDDVSLGTDVEVAESPPFDVVETAGGRDRPRLRRDARHHEFDREAILVLRDEIDVEIPRAVDRRVVGDEANPFSLEGRRYVGDKHLDPWADD